jgi:hypothetical protein
VGVTVRAIFRDDDEKKLTRTVRYNLQPQVIITEPRDFQIFGPVNGSGNALNLTGVVERPINVTGFRYKLVERDTFQAFPIFNSFKIQSDINIALAGQRSGKSDFI